MKENNFEELFGKMAVRRKGARKKAESSDPDQKLIQRFLSGEEGAFNQLVLNYQNRVYGLCYQLLGSLDEAEEVAQEVFLTVYRSLKDFRGESRFSTWLYRVTVNHCKNRMKYLGRRGYYQSDSLEEPVETEKGEISRQLADEAQDPLEYLEQKEIQILVRKKIMDLAEDHRVVILLRDLEGLSYQEIARILELKEGTVKSRIHRARAELKSLLEKELFK